MSASMPRMGKQLNLCTAEKGFTMSEATHTTVKNDVWNLAQSLTTGTRKVKSDDGKVTEVKRALTPQKLVSVTNKFLETRKSISDALAYGKGKLAIDSGYNLDAKCFDDHFDNDGETVNMNNSGACVKAYSNNIKTGANLLLTHGSKLANALRFGINRKQSSKINPIIHAVLQKSTSKLKITSANQFKAVVKGKLSENYQLPEMLKAIAEGLEKSKLPHDMVVRDIRIGKRYAKKGGCHVTEQSLEDWILELHKLASEAEDTFSAEQKKLEVIAEKRAELQSNRKNAEAKAKSKARLMAQRIVELNELLKNTSTDDSQKVEGAKEIVSAMLDEASTETK